MVMSAADNLFGVKLEYETTRNYTDMGGISMKKLISKGPDLLASMDEVFESVKLCSLEVRASGYLDEKKSHKNVYCLDYIHDSHWDQAHTGLGAKSSPTKGSTTRNRQTSAFLVGNSLAGRVLPPIMFTTNDLFKRKRGRLNNFTKKNLEIMSQSGIADWQFVHLCEIIEPKKGQNVAGELKEMAIRALQLWR